MSADPQPTAGAVSGPARADVAPQETNALERAILECADYAIISTTPEGVILTFNRAAERMLGYAPAEVVGRVTPEIFHDREEVARRAAKLTAELGWTVAPGFETFVAKPRLGLADEQEWTCLRKDGSRFPARLSVTVMRDGAGVITGFLGIAHDISEHKHTEQVTATFAELGRALSAADSRRAAAGTIMVAADKLLRFDAALLHLMSKDRRRVFRVLTVDTVNGWRAEQPVEYEACEPSLMFRRVLRQGAQLVLRDGQVEATIPFEPFGDPQRQSASLMFVPLRAGDNTLGILSLQSYTPRDYTKADLELLQSLADHAAGAFERLETEDTLAESEQRFRGTFEQAAVGVAHIGLDGRWLRVNDWVCDIVGYSREELMAKTFQDITHPDDLAPDLEFVRRMLAGEIPHYGMEKRYFHKDGSLVWIRLTVSLVRAADGVPKYFISIIQDIRARKAAEEALLQARNELEHRVQERTAELGRANMLLHTEVEERKNIEAERERLIAELQSVLTEVKTLSGLLPICGWCKKIRDDSGYWNSVEGYLKKSSGMDITHGICPECSAKMMVDLDKVTGPAPPAS